MYVTSSSWLESGPTRPIVARVPVAVPVPTMIRLGVRPPETSRGVGAIPQLSQEHCDSWWSLANPVAWLGGCAARDVANVYERVQYGTVPKPGDLPGPPAPNAPQTREQMRGDWTPEQSGITPQQWAAFTQSQRDYLEAQARSGAWNPEGNIPFNAIDLANFWRDYGTPVMILGGLGVAALLYKAVKG